MAPWMPCCYGRTCNDLCLNKVLCFCKYFANSHFILEPDYIFRKPVKRRFQQYIVDTDIILTFHARVEYISVQK